MFEGRTVAKVFIPVEQQATRVAFDIDGRQLECRRVIGADADELADCASLIADLQGVKAGFNHLLATVETSANSELDKVIFDGSAVRYRRCFGSGVRLNFNLDSYLEGLNPQQRSYHEHLLGITNKHVAHSVSNFEDQALIAMIDGESYAGLAIMHFSMATTSSDFLKVIVQCCDFFIEKVLGHRSDELHRAIDQRLADMSVDAIRQFPEPIIQTPFGRTGALKKRK